MTYSNSAMQAYANTAAVASPIRSVIMLYDGVIRLARGAKRAIEEGRVEDRFVLTQKASKIVLGLQASLDWENGGEVTPSLHGFYNTIFMRLQQVNFRNSLEVCDDIVVAMENVRDSWIEVEKQMAGGGHATAALPAPAPSAPAASANPEKAKIDPNGASQGTPLPPGRLGITI